MFKEGKVKVNKRDLTNIENMIIDIHNDYVSRIREKEKENYSLSQSLANVQHENAVLTLQVDKRDNQIEKLKKEKDLMEKSIKVLENRIKELKANEITKKKLMKFFDECRTYLINSNEVAKENHALKKPNKKDLQYLGKVSSDAKEKMK